MTAPKYIAMAGILAVPMLLSSAPVQAFTARHATAQGQGIFVTSSGTPQNMMASSPVTRQVGDDNRRPLRGSRHDRYFAGF